VPGIPTFFIDRHHATAIGVLGGAAELLLGRFSITDPLAQATTTLRTIRAVAADLSTDEFDCCAAPVVMLSRWLNHRADAVATRHGPEAGGLALVAGEVWSSGHAPDPWRRRRGDARRRRAAYPAALADTPVAAVDGQRAHGIRGYRARRAVPLLTGNDLPDSIRDGQLLGELPER